MTNKKLWIIPALLLLSIIIFTLKIAKTPKFYLEDKYYGSNDFEIIETQTLNKLIKDKKSFALFIYQPACVTSSDFEQILHDFSKTKNIKIYKIAFSDIKNTKLNKKVKYYPSFTIFNKGEIVDYLNASSDEDLKYYESKENFEKWFTKYVLLKKPKKRNLENNIQKENIEENIKEISLDEVKYDKNKINIYLFWGSTCPHCKEEFAFFDEIKEKYQNYYNLYTYEVWEKPENIEIMKTFAQALNEEITAVPYTIIGNESFRGFNDDTKEKIIKAIKNNHQNSNDIYFDKIKEK